MAKRIIEIFVESSDELQEDCVMRFQSIGASRPVARIRYEPDDGPPGTWKVFGKQLDGTQTPALAAEVDDSGEGTSTLIYGGDSGVRLVNEESGRTIAEPYLLLTSDAIVE
jgi:hypothetical protein